MPETGLGRILEMMLHEPGRQKLVKQNSRQSVGDSTRWVKTQLIKSQLIYQITSNLSSLIQCYGHTQKKHVSKSICTPQTLVLLTINTAQKGNTPNSNTGKKGKRI